MIPEFAIYLGELLIHTLHYFDLKGSNDNLSQLARDIRMSGTQSTVHGPRLSINITALVGAKEEHDPGNLIGVAAPFQGVQLADPLLGAARPGVLEHRRRHTRLDETGTERVDANVGPRQLVGGRLRQGDDGSLGGRVGSTAGVGPEAGDGSRHDDAS